MYSVTVYEEGRTYDYYVEGDISAINLLVENYQDLSTLTDIILKSGHSIEIVKLDK